ncbi:MAG: Crp/Fnr family transcriptional regulator [Bdellovibrionaceae bacterium]|nr:Crp/Fnr family transcriptional regulator [Pseudobdellovibrionaceae bacterium]
MNETLLLSGGYNRPNLGSGPKYSNNPSSGSFIQVFDQQSEIPYEIIHVKEGDIIFKEGEPARGLFYVQSGCVKMYVNRSQARGRTTTPEYVTKLVGPGEYFGYKTLVKGGSSLSTAKAIKTSTIWLYSKDLILSAIQSASPLFKVLLNQSVADLENYEMTSQLHYLASVQERIAYQLIVLGDKFGVQTPNGISLNLKLTRNEFAQLASTINESLSRHLTEFKAEGLIDLNGKEIIIKNRDGLMAKSGNFTK